MTDSIDISHSERPSNIRKLVTRCMAVGRPVMLWGSPGVGKSDLIAEIGKQQRRPVIDMRLLLLDPTDLKGLPYWDEKTNTMKWAPPSDLPKEGTALSNAILFLDEINAAPPSVQAAAYQLILNRRVGEYHLPKEVSIVCAGNRDSDRGVTFRMASPLANRLVHLDIAPNFDDWNVWAIDNRIHPDVVGFLTNHKHKLFDFDPKGSSKAFPTPRTWAFVSQLLDDDMPESLTSTLVAGTVGDGVAGEFMAHRRLSAKMPRPNDVLLGKVTKLETKEISAMWSLTISLCYTLKEWMGNARDGVDGFDIDQWHKCVDRYLQFMMTNYPHEMVVMGAKAAFTQSASTQSESAPLPIDHRKLTTWKAFYTTYGKFILEA